MAKRTGVTKLHGIARTMCKTIVLFAPIIRKTYPENVALQVALETAMVACDALEVELASLLEYGD